MKRNLFRGRIVKFGRTILFCAAQRSKWSEYLGTGLFGERKGSGTSGLHLTEHDESATTEATTDAVVDDEVHPDFL